MKVGNKVSFIDKTGELLTGVITKLDNPNIGTGILTVDCFKKSWDMDISCLVPKSHVTLINNNIK